MKILWLDINASYVHASLALPAIHAQCGDDGAEWEVVSATTATPVGTLVEQVVERSPALICATAWLFTHDYLLQAVARVKALLPGCLIMLGGPEFLGGNETYLRAHTEIDAVFRGEGEESFPKWLKTAENRSGWNGITGLCFIDENGIYVDGSLARVMDFAALNPPESSRFFRWDKPFVQLETVRGCFNSCTFCVSGAEKPVRATSIESVRQRIENIHAHGIREIRLLDRTFNGNAKRAIELISLFAEYPELRFHLEIHPALLSFELKDLLKKLPKGLLHLEAGIQSLREPVLKACKRAGSLDEALDGLQFLCSLDNMEVHADLIVGLPHYTLGQIYEDIGTLVAFGAGEIQLELLKVLPGTEMREKAESWGLVYSTVPPYEVLQTPDLTVAEAQTGRLLSRLLDRWYNAPVWQAITRKLILEVPGFLPDFLAWLRVGEYLEQPLSVEKRGLLLFQYIAGTAPEYLSDLADAWTRGGLSERKIRSFLE